MNVWLAATASLSNVSTPRSLQRGTRRPRDTRSAALGDGNRSTTRRSRLQYTPPTSARACRSAALTPSQLSLCRYGQAARFNNSTHLVGSVDDSLDLEQQLQAALLALLSSYPERCSTILRDVAASASEDIATCTSTAERVDGLCGRGVGGQTKRPHRPMRAIPA